MSISISKISLQASWNESINIFGSVNRILGVPCHRSPKTTHKSRMFWGNNCIKFALIVREHSKVCDPSLSSPFQPGTRFTPRHKNTNDINYHVKVTFLVWNFTRNIFTPYNFSSRPHRSRDICKEVAQNVKKKQNSRFLPIYLYEF